MAARKKSSKTSDRLDANRVLEFAKKHKKFSTEQLAKALGVRPQQAAAGIAICRIKEKLDHGQVPPSSNPDQSSRWLYTG